MHLNAAEGQTNGAIKRAGGGRSRRVLGLMLDLGRRLTRGTAAVAVTAIATTETEDKPVVGCDELRGLKKGLVQGCSCVAWE